eukprot:TRINITY_DN52405_c0_g1_i1.p1 TRINITY_DN52405_c0_g1~~TRINITY_DN52405_c0_g1_i1.p1  ORF type:complete len:525 (-),score=93.35 TRINITY_DN52405_c0_g1_i1:27-1601(-)
MAYKPGGGLPARATEGLRDRQRVRESRREADGARLASRLLGNGIQKVVRCGRCTRPMDEAAKTAGHPACSRCLAKDAEKAAEEAKPVEHSPSEEACDTTLSDAAAGSVIFCKDDADEGVVVSKGGARAACNADDAWLGVRGWPAVLKGAYVYEVQVLKECLVRVGWAAPTSRRALGTDDRSFGYGGTGMKSHANKFDPYGEVYEARQGAVLTCCLDRRDARSQTISYSLDGTDLGVAFRLPLWMADVPLLPAVCGREDWQVAIRGCMFKFDPGPPYRPLYEMAQECKTMDRAAYKDHSPTKECLGPAPQEQQKHIEEFDVPDSNLVEIRSQGDETLDESDVLSWLVRECEVPKGDLHIELTETCSVAVVAFSNHRWARSLLAVPPPMSTTHVREDFSEAADELLRAKRPEDRAETTDRVARRFVAGALADDKGAGSVPKEKLRELRKPASRSLQQVQGILQGAQRPPRERQRAEKRDSELNERRDSGARSRSAGRNEGDGEPSKDPPKAEAQQPQRRRARNALF